MSTFSSACCDKLLLCSKLGHLSFDREAVGKMHGKEAAEQVHIHSLQGLCALLLPKNIPSRQREADLAARQSTLVEAVATPVRHLVNISC